MDTAHELILPGDLLRQRARATCGVPEEIDDDFAPVVVDGADIALLDAVVQQINRIYNRKGLETALAIGELLIQHCFNGDASSVHSKSRHPNSFRALAARDDLEASPSFLYFCVAVTAQFRTLPNELSWKLSMAHHKVLLLETEPEAKLVLATAAVAEHWSSERLRTVVQQRHSDTSRPSSGRPSLPRFVKVARFAREAVQLLAEQPLAQEEIRRLGFGESAISIDAALEDLRQVVAWLEELEGFIRADET